MTNITDQLVHNLVNWFIKAEQRNIYELETSVGNPPLRESHLEDAKKIHQILQSIHNKIRSDDVFTVLLAPDEDAMFQRILDYGIQEEEKEITLLSGPGGNREFIPDCHSRMELLKTLVQVRADIK